MKIISKFKDFYDYKMSKYGIDEKLIYSRKNYYEYYQGYFENININDRISEEYFNKNLKENTEYSKEENYHSILFVGEKLIHLFFTKDAVYTHFDIKYEEDLKKKYKYHIGRKEITFNNGKKYNISSAFREEWNDLLLYDRKKMIVNYSNILKDDIFLNEPMLLIKYIGEYKKYPTGHSTSIFKFDYNPCLSKLGVYINEDFVWQSLVEFLANKKTEREVIPKVSNENKILSKGFDLKFSFRPNIKEKK